MVKRICSTVFLVLVFVCLPAEVQGQTLTEKLLLEDPIELVKQAREKGDIVRGAILFHQGNINCAKCHRASSERDRIGPDLSRIGFAIKDELIVESILRPSKVVKEDYETVRVLTLEGHVVEGIVVTQDANQVVVRSRQNVDEVTHLQRDAIEEIRRGELSSMPDNLADQLRNRQQFLDLLRYVFDVRDRGPITTIASSRVSTRRTLEPQLEGMILIHKFNCVACHKSDLSQLSVSAKNAPRLKWSVKHLNPKFIEAFLENPHAVQAGTTMPNTMSHLTDQQRKQAAKAITHYLVDEFECDFENQTANPDAIVRGHEVFHTVGCVACHSPRESDATEQTLGDSIPLGNLAGKYSIPALVEFLEDPLSVRISGHMPNMQLTHREASDIAHFLMQAAVVSNNEFVVERDLVALGRSQFIQHRCASCHNEMNYSELPEPIAIALNDAEPNRGCLSDANGEWPKFQFTISEKAFIRSALESQTIEFDNEQQIAATLKTFNCIACHNRDALGGVTAERNQHFRTTNLNLGDQGRIPPTLTGVGAKLNPKWIRDVMVNRRKARPYMETRMPQFGEQNVGHLTDLFVSTDRLQETQFAEFEDQKKTREQGLELAGSKGLNCVACHTYQYKISDTMPAVDLTEMTERLNKDWFYQYMLNPQKFSPNTVMPSFWPDGNGLRKDLAGGPKDQVEALWQYLLDGRQARAPRGVVREALEIVVLDEAKMLRRSYPNIGKRGIGVGYPGGVNLAFDAEQMRLAYIWKGKFVDPGGVWTGQGAGNVRPMGKTIQFAKGPDIDRLDNHWIVDDERPPNHQFRGYALDNLRRPKFRYSIGDVQVEDYFKEVEDGDGKAIRRTVTFQAAETAHDLRFRIASGAITEEADGYQIGERLKVRLVSESSDNRMLSRAEGMLIAPISLKPKQKLQTIVEYLWK